MWPWKNGDKQPLIYTYCTSKTAIAHDEKLTERQSVIHSSLVDDGAKNGNNNESVKCTEKYAPQDEPIIDKFDAVQIESEQQKHDRLGCVRDHFDSTTHRFQRPIAQVREGIALESQSANNDGHDSRPSKQTSVEV